MLTRSLSREGRPLGAVSAPLLLSHFMVRTLTLTIAQALALTPTVTIALALALTLTLILALALALALTLTLVRWPPLHASPWWGSAPRPRV